MVRPSPGDPRAASLAGLAGGGARASPPLSDVLLPAHTGAQAATTGPRRTVSSSEVTRAHLRTAGLSEPSTCVLHGCREALRP
eukprot:4473253-Prymnesium_polylepis.1